MECNKDEAIRAKGIAEKKMQIDDFEGARKIAQKAQKLFPELENIYQLITVCDVHCSAQNKICGSEMDWYGILQVEKLADEVTIKKQYRKLALLLHPDKNKFPGAESAFKLIGEANMVLSDIGKRSLYDTKCRVSVRTAATKPPPHQLNRNSCHRKQYVPTEISSSNGRQAFWTSCPFCNTRYQYYRDFVNRTLPCQNCSKHFVAYDLGAQSIPPRSNFVQPAIPQQKPAQSQGSFKVATENIGGFPPSNMASQGNFSSNAVGSKPVSKTGSTAGVGGGSTTKVKENGCTNDEGGKERVGSAKFDAVKQRESGTSRHTSKKRRRKSVVESSESGDAAASSDTEEVIQENVGSPAGQNSGLNGVHHPRRSFRKRQDVSYSESLGLDDDFASPRKMSKVSASSKDSKEELKEEIFNNGVSKTDNSTGFAAVNRDKEGIRQKGYANPEGSLPNRNCQGCGEEAVMADCNAETPEVDDSGSDSDTSCVPDPVYCNCPDPEFHDFDKDREESCFAADQIWACYDTTDSMPRFYARIRKVFSPGVRLRITWLEPRPEDQDAIKWFNEDLPVACGKFIQGSSEVTTDRLMFSHQVHFEKGRSRCSYMIFPRRGETWALFKDWDVSWSSDPENHKRFKFEIVEVLSDFVEDASVKVAYLDKVEGFVSVFQLTKREGIVSFLIPPTQLLRFSHRIPSVKLMGTEREGIPEGSFELDPSALVTLFDECGHVKTEVEILDVKANGSNPRSPGKGLKSMKSTEKLNTPEKRVGFEGKIDFEKQTFITRRSPRELNKVKKQDQMNGSQCPTQEGTDKDLDDAKSMESTEKVNTPEKRVGFEGKIDYEKETFILRRSPRELNKDKKQNQMNDGQCPTQEGTGKDLDDAKSMKSTEKLNTPEKHVGFEGKIDFEKETFILRRSPRELNKGKKQNQIDDSQCPTQEGTVKDLDAKDKKHAYPKLPKGSTPESDGGEKTNLPFKNASPQISAKNPRLSQSFSPGGQIHHFDGDKSEGKFEPGQIWAIHNDEDRIPNIYAQVKKIESSPFVLHVTMLEACTLPKDRAQAVCCGTFKLQTGKAREFLPGLFSHVIKAESLGKNRFRIFPRGGEIWALYKDWNADMSWSILTKGKYQVVQVLEDNEHCIKVSPLVYQEGSKFVFKALRRLRSSSGLMEIPLVELARFSHQIPSVKLAAEKDGLGNCWKLDPASMPDFSTRFTVEKSPR